MRDNQLWVHGRIRHRLQGVEDSSFVAPDKGVFCIIGEDGMVTSTNTWACGVWCHCYCSSSLPQFQTQPRYAMSIWSVWSLADQRGKGPEFVVSESHVPFALPDMTCPWNLQFRKSRDDQALISLLFVWLGPQLNGPGMSSRLAP